MQSSAKKSNVRKPQKHKKIIKYEFSSLSQKKSPSKAEKLRSGIEFHESSQQISEKQFGEAQNEQKQEAELDNRAAKEEESQSQSQIPQYSDESDFSGDYEQYQMEQYAEVVSLPFQTLNSKPSVLKQWINNTMHHLKIPTLLLPAVFKILDRYLIAVAPISVSPKVLISMISLSVKMEFRKAVQNILFLNLVNAVGGINQLNNNEHMVLRAINFNCQTPDFWEGLEAQLQIKYRQQTEYRGTEESLTVFESHSQICQSLSAFNKKIMHFLIYSLIISRPTADSAWNVHLPRIILNLNGSPQFSDFIFHDPLTSYMQKWQCANKNRREIPRNEESKSAFVAILFSPPMPIVP